MLPVNDPNEALHTPTIIRMRMTLSGARNSRAIEDMAPTAIASHSKALICEDELRTMFKVKQLRKDTTLPQPSSDG